jgi:hypothetical protein
MQHSSRLFQPISTRRKESKVNLIHKLVIYASDIVYIVRAHQFMSKETYLHASGEMGDFGKTNAAVLEQIQSAPVPIEEKSTQYLYG